MKVDVEKWIGEAWSTLEAIPGASSVVAQEKLRWDDFKDLETLEIVVFGAYDSGKSSLMKRLLVDWGSPVPEWLTVSGRRETFESKRVEIQGIGLIDTPGLASGADEHDGLALDTQSLADAYLWVMPPQLVTTGKERFFDLLFGDAGCAKETIAIIARMDEAGMDPYDNPSGFADLCIRKQRELSALVASAPSPKELRAVHCVAADPYQMVGNTPNPERHHYDSGREWDGIEALAADVHSLLEERTKLRLHAGARFVLSILRKVQDEIARQTEELALQKEGVENEIDRHKIHEQRLNALQQQTGSVLHERVENVMLSGSRVVDAGPDALRSLEESLAKAVDDWAEGAVADYRQLAGELELEVNEQMAGPSMDGFRHLIRKAEKHAGETDTSNSTGGGIARRVIGLGPTLRRAFEDYAAADLGMSLKEASKRLEMLDSPSKAIEKFANVKGGGSAFRGAEHMSKARDYVKWANVIGAIGPVVEQLGGLLSDIADERMTQKRAAERAQRRNELRQELRVEMEKLKKSAATGLDAIDKDVRHWLTERLSVFTEAHDKISAQLLALENASTSIDELLGASPL